MKLIGISIENYRSICNKVMFDLKRKNCNILLGINESGKSNILEAISLADSSTNFSYSSDCNKKKDSKDIIINYSLFIENKSFYIERFVKDGIPEELTKEIEIIKIEREIKIDSSNKKIDTYLLEIKDKSKIFNDFVFRGDDIVKLDEAVERDESGNPIGLLTKIKLEEYLSARFHGLFELNTPKIIFWKSDPKYLIEKSIDLNLFKDDVNLSIPLKNIFKIAGVEDINKRIESIIGNQAKTEELQEQLSESITKHINNIWKEHEISIKIRIDNMQLCFLVTDKDDSIPKYEVNQRSDGFKHFVSILLNLSIENDTNELENKVILLDEPEVHLHPTGQKYLLEELLKISKNNILFFATHSIFMIDKKNLNRHYSVEKESGITNITPIDKDNPYKEEVLYEALGTSILEHLNNCVILVEGKTDRDIFVLYNKKFKSGYPLNISVISADGCQNIIKYTKFFNGRLIKGYVLVDSDSEGREMKKRVLLEDNYNSGNVFEINDCISGKDRTLEDLFDKQFLINAVKEQYNLDIVIDESKPFIEQIKKILADNRKPYRDDDKERLKQIFFREVSKLNKSELEGQSYFSFYVKLHQKLTS